MAKKYVVEGASIHCKYCMTGADRKLYTSTDTCVRIGGKLITTEVDDSPDCFGGGFGVCTSPFADGAITSLMHQTVSNIQQLSKIGYYNAGAEKFLECQYKPAFYWQNAHERVEVYGCRTLLEDSWTFCTHGMGFITIDDHGQAGDNPAQQIEENLKKLNRAVDQYMKENGIDSKHRNDLLDSILLWNGYYILPWKYEGTEMTRAFCAYLELEDPALFNYFERGLYLPDGNDPIDVTYMLGIYKAKEQGKEGDIFSMVNVENANDMGMLSGYLEAYRTENGKSTMEVLTEYLDYYQSSDYDRASRYNYIVETRNDAMINAYCTIVGINPDDYDRQELAFGNLTYVIDRNSPHQGGSDEAEIAKMDELRKQTTDKFIETIKENME